MASYEIQFKIGKYGGMYTTNADSIADVKDGFWVTEDGQFTKMCDCYAFILPHMINYIVKV